MSLSESNIKAFDPENVECFFQAIKDYQGDGRILSSAIGFHSLGAIFVWRVLYLVHSKRTVRKYEKLLNMKVRDLYPEMTLDSVRSIGIQEILIGNLDYWKVVSGSISCPLKHHIMNAHELDNILEKHKQEKESCPLH